MATDVMLVETQQWIKSTYEDLIDVPTDGTGRAKTIKGLIKALQIELQTVSADGVWGEETAKAFDKLFPDGLNKKSKIEAIKSDIYRISNIIYILRGGFYTSRGINPLGLNDEFTDALEDAVKKFQDQAGIEQTGKVKSYLMRAILTTDVYELQNDGDANIRQIQQALNNKYYTIIPLIPTNGIYERATNIALIKAIQKELGVEVDGWWGENTMRVLPVLRRYGAVTNKQMVYILQYLLYLNGYNPNGFDGAFGGGAQSAVKSCQRDYNLTPDGICGRQTWAALIVSCGDQARNCTACDTVYEITERRANILISNGYNLVGRYLSNVEGGTLNKKIQEGELQRIFSAGLKVFPIFQENSRELENFTHLKGVESAEKAIKAAKLYGFPKGTEIFFAVDMDLYKSQMEEYVVPFFRGIKNTIKRDGTYKVGAYGSRQVCTILKGKDLIEHAFLCDASYKFEGNIAKKIPSCWAYDQFAVEVKLEDDFYIDKIVDNGILNGVNSLETYHIEEDTSTYNKELCSKLKTLYEITTEYMLSSSVQGGIRDVNRLVLQFLRSKSRYVDSAFSLTTGDLDIDYLYFVEGHRKYTEELEGRNLKVYLHDIKKYMDIEHLAVTCETFLKREGSKDLISQNSIDLTGWAGDLIQLAGEITKVCENISDMREEQIANLIGCNNDDFAISLGFESAEKTGFGVVDLIQDIDAYNLGFYMTRTNERIKIYELFDEYYSHSYKIRAINFVSNLKAINNMTNVGDINAIYNIADKYTEKKGLEKAIVTVFEKAFGSFDENAIGNKMAKAFSEKIMKLKEDE